MLKLTSGGFSTLLSLFLNANKQPSGYHTLTTAGFTSRSQDAQAHVRLIFTLSLTTIKHILQLFFQHRQEASVSLYLQ